MNSNYEIEIQDDLFFRYYYELINLFIYYFLPPSFGEGHAF